MTWDPEKYRDKREKVLGIRKRGVSFGSMAALVSVAILLGFAFISVPEAVSYLKTRHLDDAIYRLGENRSWPADLLAELRITAGVAATGTDHHDSRLVVTFDRRLTDPDRFNTLFLRYDVTPTLLNRVNHRQHQTAMKAEKEAEGETP